MRAGIFEKSSTFRLRRRASQVNFAATCRLGTAVVVDGTVTGAPPKPTMIVAHQQSLGLQ